MEVLERCGVYLDRPGWGLWRWQPMRKPLNALARFFRDRAGIYNEHFAVRAINDSLCRLRFGPSPGLPYGWNFDAVSGFSPRLRQRVGQFVRRMDIRARNLGLLHWAVKDPRMTLFSDLWLPHFDVVVATFLQPGAAIRSDVGHGWLKGPDRERTVRTYWVDFNRRLLEIERIWGGAQAHVFSGV
jgi:hypothetical protein